MQLIKWDKIRTTIETSNDIQELTTIKDKLRAYQILAEQSKQSAEVQSQIAIYKARADRKCGQWLKGNVKHGGDRKSSSHDGNLKLKDIKITGKESSRLQKIADIPEEKFENILNEAEQETKKVTNNMLVKVAKEIDRVENVKNIQNEIVDMDPVEGKYDVVILDPPWMYGREYDSSGSRIASPYPEQTQDEIDGTCKNFFKDDCVLWLWTTHRFLWDAKNLLDKWKFEYKATLVWNKDKMGMGSWLRMQCEFCLVAVKGSPYFKNTTERDIITEKRREHSRKPEAFYEVVKKTCRGMIFEYYSREKKDGIITMGIENGKLGR